jgi:hypothetical protein
MAQEVINIGAQADDGTGDTIRGAGIKINNNFTELYATPFAQTSLGLNENEISTTQTNADIVLKPSGTGSILFPGIRFNDNNIETVNADTDLILRANGSGSVVIDGLGFSGTSIHATDSSIVNINENLIVDGTLSAGATTFAGTVQTGSTLDVAGLTTLSTLTVSGASSFVGTTTVDNLTFDDNIISSSSNADINLTPGGTGVVNVSNLTIDSSINLTDNVIKVTRSNDDLLLSANGTGSVQISKVDMNEGTVDNTVIGATTPAAATFTTITVPSVNADKVNITDNKIKATDTDANLVVGANGSGNVLINGFTFPNTVSAGQLIKTNGSKVLSTVVFPFVVSETDVQDGTATLTGNSTTQTIDSFSTSTYRSAKYTIQISDSTANRYKLVEANVTHNGSAAFISITGGASNGAGDGSTIYDSLDLSADISGGNVRLRGTVNNTNNQVIKFVKRVIKV